MLLTRTPSRGAAVAVPSIAYERAAGRFRVIGARRARQFRASIEDVQDLREETTDP